VKKKFLEYCWHGITPITTNFNGMSGMKGNKKEN
jgi:hypothetical protein